MYLGLIGNLGQQHFRASEPEYVINAWFCWRAGGDSNLWPLPSEGALAHWFNWWI